MYENEIKKTNCKIKIIEKAGKSIAEIFQKSYPFDRIRCRQGECFVCDSGGKGNCKRENVTYEIACLKEGCKYKYIGETSRNAKTRGKEHLTDLIKQEEQSVLDRHLKEIHNRLDNSNTNSFQMNVIGNYRSALDRQVAESIKIDLAQHPLINNRCEYRSNNMLKAHFTTKHVYGALTTNQHHSWRGSGWIEKLSRWDNEKEKKILRIVYKEIAWSAKFSLKKTKSTSCLLLTLLWSKCIKLYMKNDFKI